jgi:hypothetical protein
MARGEPSQTPTSHGGGRWEEAMKPSRQRNMDQSQRDSLAKVLRQLRAKRAAANEDRS